MTVKVFFIFAFIGCSSVFDLRASTFGESLFQTATEEYQKGNFEKALRGFLELQQLGHHSGEICYNIGNCYFKLKRLGQAILYYEKASRLLKRDPDLRYNLGYAESLVKDKIRPEPSLLLLMPFQEVARRLTIWELSLLNVGLIWVLLLILTLRKKIKLPFFKSLIGVLCAVEILLFIAGYMSYLAEVATTEAIIVSKHVEIRSGPSKSFPVNFKAHEGFKISILEEELNWSKISLPNGFTGWIRKGTYEKI